MFSSGGEIHHGVRAPARRPRHLLHLFVDRGANRRVADVGVDLHQKVPSDDHRLAFGMIDVRRQDRTPARELVADELRLDALAQRDELHFARNLAAPRVVHLRHVRSRFRAPRSARRRKPQTVELTHRISPAPVDRRRVLEFDGVAARHDPRLAQRRQPAANVDGVFRIAVWPARVVERMDGSIRQRDRAARYANRGVGPLNVNLHSNLPTPALSGSGRLRSASLGLALSASTTRASRVRLLLLPLLDGLRQQRRSSHAASTLQWNLPSHRLEESIGKRCRMAAQMSREHMALVAPDPDPQETREWLDAMRGVLAVEGNERARVLIERLVDEAQSSGAQVSLGLHDAVRQYDPGRTGSRRCRATASSKRACATTFDGMRLRWSCVQTRSAPSSGGHVASFASAATLYDVGFNHFFRAPSETFGGDLVFFQGHSSPGVYARAFLEGRITEEQLETFSSGG